MARLPTTSAFLLAVLAVAATGRAEPIATRQNAFRIPFRLVTPADESQRPVEVQLFVSDDRGANWRPYNRVVPDAAGFNFRSDRDGEFWFLVRTKDASGRILPDRPAEPELKVLIDTVQPSLDILAERGAGGEVTLNAQADGDHLVIEVADRGVGIAPEDRAQLFTPYHRGANSKGVPGAGIGLYLSRHLVDVHGGDITAAPRDGGGTCITVRLPLRTPPRERDTP